MSELIATPVVKNKFWVVENHGTKIATIQARDDGGVVFVHDHEREYFPSVKILKAKYNIKFGSLKKPAKKQDNTVYGFPIIGKSFNEVFDVHRKLPMYSKTAKSKSFYCAGHYLVNFTGAWNQIFCPKNITLARYEFVGPFRSEKEMLKKLKELQ